MATIKSAVENYTGNRAGIAFIDGVGETDNPHLIEWFTAHGYTVEDEKADKTAETKKRKSSKSDNQ